MPGGEFLEDSLTPPPEDVSDADWQAMCLRAQAGEDLAAAIDKAEQTEWGDDFEAEVLAARDKYRKAVNG
jgi:hypothetical protein